MPSQAQVAAASELSETGAVVLASYLRASAFYLAFSWAFTGLDAAIEVTIEGETKSKMLSAILTGIEGIGDGTVGAQGGEFGADYAQSRDREQLCMLALSVIFDFAALGIVVNGDTASFGGQSFAIGSGLRGGTIIGTGTPVGPFTL